MQTGADAAVAAVPPVENLGNALGEVCQLARMALLPLLPLLTVVARLAVVAVMAMVAVAVHALFDPRRAGVAWMCGRRMYRIGRLTPCRIFPTIDIGFSKQREGSREWVVPTAGVQRRWGGLGARRWEAFLALVVVVQKQHVSLRNALLETRHKRPIVLLVQGQNRRRDAQVLQQQMAVVLGLRTVAAVMAVWTAADDAVREVPAGDGV
mmetsp:Transcript_62095/g.109335  ORF Transcript_62095/g.109335 Transcript_62095/m.109335 type:complete len:209 (-) Transcript_62095:2020-2646(-)